MSYKVFSRAHDEVVAAADLVPRPSAPIQWWRPLPGASTVERAQRECLWLMREEARRARRHAVAQPATASPSGLVATMLIDHSGSMVHRLLGAQVPLPERGYHLAAILAARFGDLARTLGIPFEILGFTTRSWRGEPVREEWVAAGSPEGPGRLCALRHIVYSDFGDAAEPWLGAMFLADLYKENVDGEALEWAAERLAAEPATRRLLFVVSDGAPVDDSTLDVNRATILENHLKEVIARIGDEGAIELHGIGIGETMRPCYGSACRVGSERSAREDGLRFIREALAGTRGGTAPPDQRGPHTVRPEAG